MADYALFEIEEPPVTSDSPGNNGYKVWMCIICGWMYDEEKGAPEEGLAPGTRWEDVPEDWYCPDCAAGKEDFEMVEV